MNDQHPHATGYVGYDSGTTSSYAVDPLFGTFPGGQDGTGAAAYGHGHDGGPYAGYDTAQAQSGYAESWTHEQDAPYAYPGQAEQAPGSAQQGYDSAGWQAAGHPAPDAPDPSGQWATGDWQLAPTQSGTGLWNQSCTDDFPAAAYTAVPDGGTSPYDTPGYGTAVYGTGDQDTFGAGFDTTAYAATAFATGTGGFDLLAPDGGAHTASPFETGAFDTSALDPHGYDSAAFGATGFETGTYGATAYDTGAYDATAWNQAGPSDATPGTADYAPEHSSGRAPEHGAPEQATHERATDPDVSGDAHHAADDDAPYGQHPYGDAEPGGPADEDAEHGTAAEHHDAGPHAPAGTVRPGGRSATRNRARRRTPSKRSALLTVAVPSACVMSVAGIAAASVGGMGGEESKDNGKTAMAADDDATVKTVAAANSKLDTQLANVRAAGEDFRDRASRTQERIDLAARAAAEKKRRADEAARKEAARPKFVLPVEQHGLSAYYGQAGVNWMSVHSGIDFPVSYGTPVMAATDGTVRTQWNSAYGNMAIVTMADGTETWYCHLSSTKIRSGSVKAGDVIAYSGNSGNSTGPHLHFEVRPGGGSAINPLPWLNSHGIDPQ
ncbi:M23 family metallopeptidase [uncultured Streptomyces sp.]|uniref:M23 family metallopeptidase n=1 Tax=uncultured Streptomyces sp. TaxID=174707 RepID=UPI002628DA6D|nr:peptidoglycan DD-metalloendopeptidase family protein [uncultured Streptomyces sp.]